MVAKDFELDRSHIVAKRLNMSDVLQLLEDDDFCLSEEDDSNFEGEGVESYLPRATISACLKRMTVILKAKV